MNRLITLFLISTVLSCADKGPAPDNNPTKAIKTEPSQTPSVKTPLLNPVVTKPIITPTKPVVTPESPVVVQPKPVVTQPKPVVTQTPRDLLITAATNGDLLALNNVIKGGLKLRDNNNGIDALKAAKDPAVRERIVEVLFDEFQPDYKKGEKDIGSAIREAFKTDKVAYEEFMDELIKKRRTKVTDAQLLGELAYMSELFEKLKDMGVDLNQPVSAYGLSGNDAGPLIVTMTSIGANVDQAGAVKIKIAQSLLDAGADINAKDLKGHTALYYADIEAGVGHEWQRKGFIALAQFLKSKGALKI